VREIPSQVLEFWSFERFRGLTAKEVWAMLNLVTPIQETKAYQSIFAEGKTDGLKRLLTRRFRSFARLGGAADRCSAGRASGGLARWDLRCQERRGVNRR